MKHFLLCSLLLLGILDAEELALDPYISGLKHKEFNYDYEKSVLEKKKLRDSWIQPLQLRYSISKSNPYNEQDASTQQTQNAAIVMDQPIFKSGGIYYGIKFAQASYEYNKYSIDVAKRKLIKEAVQLLIQIKQNELNLQKQELQIDNSRINLELKQEQYLNGQLDSGFLNNAIIEKNKVTQALFDLQTSLERLISQFESISDLDYKQAATPHLRLVSSEQFLEHNIDIKQLQSEGERNLYNKNVTIAKYLPTVSLTAGYNWDKFENPSFAGTSVPSPPETQYYNYGLKATIPLDFNTFRDVESSRVEYLKSLVVIDDKKRELTSLYEQVTQNLNNYDKKIALSEENQALYLKLLDETTQLYKAGYKTEYDVRTLSNSVKIEEVEQSTFELDKQLELLNLYEKLMNDLPADEDYAYSTVRDTGVDKGNSIEKSDMSSEMNRSIEKSSFGVSAAPVYEEKSVQRKETIVKEKPLDKIKKGDYVQVASFSHSSVDEKLTAMLRSNDYTYLLHKVDVDGNTFTKVLVGPIEDDKNRTEMLQEIREKIAEDAFLFRL
jgi:outer membrane protein TolC